MRLPAWARNVHAWPARGRWWRCAIVGLRVVAEIGLALTVLTLGPQLLGPWPLAFFGAPDIAWWLAGMATLLLGIGLARGLLLVRILVRPTDAHASATGSLTAGRG